jgi:hypothetical protein
MEKTKKTDLRNGNIITHCDATDHLDFHWQCSCGGFCHPITYFERKRKNDSLEFQAKCNQCGKVMCRKLNCEKLDFRLKKFKNLF